MPVLPDSRGVFSSYFFSRETNTWKDPEIMRRSCTLSAALKAQTPTQRGAVPGKI